MTNALAFLLGALLLIPGILVFTLGAFIVFSLSGGFYISTLIGGLLVMLSIIILWIGALAVGVRD